jgi:flagellar biosynthesis protein FlhA
MSEVDDSLSLRRIARNSDVLLAVGLAGVLTTLVIPLPTAVLDVLLAVNMSAALLTLLITLSAREPLEFSTFPSLLLFLTLFRLSLNVASTRLILLQADAGRIIASFGGFVVGGNMVVGLVVFIILVVIQFIVITKGAERISEVAARFTLDAMPGKQMSIDADLNAGLITEEEARRRRQKIVHESEFYGAMDGASKFVRGDAVAGLVIIFVNLVGGVVIGVSQQMSLSESARTYSILTKSSSGSNLSAELSGELLAKHRPIAIASSLVGAMVLLPGFPKVPFVLLAVLFALVVQVLTRQKRAEAKKRELKEAGAPPPQAPEPQELLKVDRFSVEVGHRLVGIVDPQQTPGLMDRIAALRRKFARSLGLMVPLVRVRSNIDLDGSEYVIKLYDSPVARGELQVGKFLAMNPGLSAERIAGEQTREPVYGLPAVWIDESRRERAELAGYTVADPQSVLITHLSDIITRYAHELLTREDVQTLLDAVKEAAPTLVADVVPNVVSLAQLQKVLQNLLREGIPIRQLERILEALGEYGQRTKDAALLTELVRRTLARTITNVHRDQQGKLWVITIDPTTEYGLKQQVVGEGEQLSLTLTPEQGTELVRRTAEHFERAVARGMESAVLLCDPVLRPHLARLLARHVPQLPVLAYDELSEEAEVGSLSAVSLEDMAEEVSVP